MAYISDQSIDMILCDPPYGRTNIEWDKALDLHQLFEHYRRIIKTNGAIVLTGQQPFVTDLISEARDIFRYDIIWKKHAPLGFLNAKRMPLRNHEHILVFYNKLPTYNPQKTHIPNKSGIGRVRKNSGGFAAYQEYRKPEWSWTETGERYPTSILDISNWNGALFGNTDRYIKHPTAKPVDLFEYLIKTFTNEGDLVLDNCIGSGTTAVASKNTGRNFIGIELKQEYCELAESRLIKNPSEIVNEQKQRRLL
ncbi:MAG: site-specific DNA-methyltransferase [Smithella sp.]